jgi:hypothetical protein
MSSSSGALQHKRFNGTSWQVTQNVGITIQ